MFVIELKDVNLKDQALVGGKNASLGEMINHLSALGIKVPSGFATTTRAYRQFLKEAGIEPKITEHLNKLEVDSIESLTTISQQIRDLILAAPISDSLMDAFQNAYFALESTLPQGTTFAVRSSATAEDLEEASFAGQQETLLNISGVDNILIAIKQIYASLFSERAISYRLHHGIAHEDLAVSVSVQQMVRSDLGASGVMFTLDTESGFEQVVLINATLGLGELLVQGMIEPDEFYVDKRLLAKEKDPILSRHLGLKHQKMILGETPDPKQAVRIMPVEKAVRDTFCLSDQDVIALAKQALIIEQHYGKPMDIEWAKDGITQTIYIVQARPETVKTQAKHRQSVRFELTEKGSVLCEGRSVGQKIGQGRACLINDLSEFDQTLQDFVLVTDLTDPDWEPIIKRARAIVTNRGGRTCHAAIIARELGIPAVVGCLNATTVIQAEQPITVSCAQGETGYVYDGLLAFRENLLPLNPLPRLPVKLMMNIGDPKSAFDLQHLPNDGVGLARLEFVINKMIGVHPKACLSVTTLPEEIQTLVYQSARGYRDPVDFYIQKLAEGIALLGSAFYPKRVIVRLSDFKSNEYANLIGGHLFEPKEANPTLGYRGALRYLSEDFKPCFELECLAVQKVREIQGLSNIELMIPFVRTPKEAADVIDLLKTFGLVRGQQGLKIHMMCEIPANAILAKDFLKYFDGFSIGSNDLTQLTLALDRDSAITAECFDERHAAVKALLMQAIQACRAADKYIGICGQGPSDHPDFANWLIEQGVESLSLVPDSIVPTWQYLAKQLKT